MSSGFEGTKGPWYVVYDPPRLMNGWEDHGGYRINAPGIEQLAYFWNTSNRMTGNGEIGPQFGAKEAQENAVFVVEAFAVVHETGLTPRQLAEQRAELLERLEVLTAACEQEFCGDGTEEMEPDDSKVSFPEDKCHITFGMIRSARAAITRATGSES